MKQWSLTRADSFKQYIKNKPTQWGIKLWVLSESLTGFVYKFQVYFGKEGDNPEQIWHGVLSETSLHQLMGTTIICIWTTSTVTLTCLLNTWTVAFIAVAKSDLGEKDFQKIFLLQKLMKSGCPRDI